jgi:hypothetical protein
LVSLLLAAPLSTQAPRSTQPQTQPAKPAPNPAADSLIRFAYQAIDFRLDSCETQRHAPETMAGGVAVFDYNRNGELDIFFTNGADIHTLRKSSPNYSNHLFENDGSGHFTDVTGKAGLGGSGFDMGLRSEITTTMDTKISSSQECTVTRSITTMETAHSPM